MTGASLSMVASIVIFFLLIMVRFIMWKAGLNARMGLLCAGGPALDGTTSRCCAHQANTGMHTTTARSMAQRSIECLKMSMLELTRTMCFAGVQRIHRNEDGH